MTPILLTLLACDRTPTPPVETVSSFVINEVMSDNRTTLRDPAQEDCPEHDDWIELYNAGDAAASLAGLTLRDSGSTLALPDLEVPAGGRVLVWADGQPEQGELHAPFGVSREGETLTLEAEGSPVDQVVVPALAPDESWARIEDGTGAFARTSSPTPDAPNHTILPDDPCFADDGTFDDHAYPCLTDRASFDAIARTTPEISVLKFDIFAFQDPAERRVAFMDTNFYALHDQFYIFTVLNGTPFQHLTDYPTYDGDFRTWDEVYDWALGIDLESEIPREQVRFAGDRLYSPYFYANINGTPRDLGVGSVIFLPGEGDREDLWGFELEAGDAIDAHDLGIYFEALEAFGPEEFEDIVWLVRSVVQEELAQQLEAAGDPLASRIVRYTELTQPGEVEVYNPGTTAGRVYMVRAGQDGLEESRDDYILVVDEIPDYLPPCSALITSVPQTPLSHVSLLARSRGIPNLYVAGITSDPGWDAWKRVRAFIALEAAEGMTVAQIDAATYTLWAGLQATPPPVLASVDPSTMPLTVDLEVAGDMPSLRPVFGGKAAGMRQILEAGIADPPDRPLGISVRPYFEHLDTLPRPDGTVEAGWLDTVLGQTPFASPSNARLRYGVLEGRAAFLERYPSTIDLDRFEAFLADHPPGDPAGDLARGEGLRGWVRDHPLDATTLSELEVTLASQFAFLPAGQGLRFRSSSTVEDLEGFNGAGLYTSETGFLDPADGPAVDLAIRTVWASYWGSEAFEERHRVGVDHLAGGMGLLVHARFDDAFERANAVVTLTRYPDGSFEMFADAQIGSISVANPPTTCPPVLPERSRVTATGVERLSPSSEADLVLTDAELQTLFDQSIGVTAAWLGTENALLAPERQREVITLDLEARAMDTGWAGSPTARLVLKQARSLDPSPDTLPENVRDLPAPEDLLARALRIDRTICEDGTLRVEIDSLRTDPLQVPDMGHAVEPFIVTLAMTADAAIPELGWALGDGLVTNHLDLSSVDLQPDGVEAVLADGMVSAGLDGWSIELGPDTATGGAMTCTTVPLWASADTFLESYLRP